MRSFSTQLARISRRLPPDQQQLLLVIADDLATRLGHASSRLPAIDW